MTFHRARGCFPRHTLGCAPVAALLLVCCPAAGAERGAEAAPAGPSPVEILDGAIHRALRWLAAHQAPDGSFRAAAFTDRCVASGARPCRSKDGDAGRGMAQFDVAVTGLALLAFTGRRITHRTGDDALRRAVERGMAFLLASQCAEGEEVGRIGAEGPALGGIIASMALAEALGLSRDRERFERPVRAAFRHLLGEQNPDGGWGSRAGEPSDTPTTAWAAWAGWTARAAFRLAGAPGFGPELDRSLEDARRFLEGMVDRRTGRPYYRAGVAGTTTPRRLGIPYVEGAAPCRSAMVLLADLVLGARRGDPVPRMLAARVRRRGLSRGRTRARREPGTPSPGLDLCWLYFAGTALFRLGDPLAAGRLGGVRDLLLVTQRRAGHEAGSWDPDGTWGPAGGRVYATALSALILELAFRYEEALAAGPPGPGGPRPAAGQAPSGNR